MASAIEALQNRVDAIRAAGDKELAGRTYLVLGRELRAFAKKRLKRKHNPIIKRVDQFDVEWLLSELASKHAANARRMT